MEIVQSGQPISKTSGLKIEKYAPSVADMFAGGKFKISSTTSVESNDKKALKQFLKLVTDGKKQEAIDLTFKATNKRLYTFGQIRKPKTTANMGDTAEGVFAAAIMARFINRNEDISVADVFKVINSLPAPKAVKGGMFVDKTVKAANDVIPEEDDVRIYIALSEMNMKFLVNRKSRAALTSYAEASVSYANSLNVKKWSKKIYENRRIDKIEVLADGVGSLPGMGQTKTKVDVLVNITNDKGKLQKVNIKVSLKVDDVKQFGQKSGVNFDREKNKQGKVVDGYKQYFKNLFGMDISNKARTYNKKLRKEKDTSGAINFIYDYVAKELKKQITNKRSKKRLLKNLGDALYNFATLSEDNVTLVQLKRSDAMIYNFAGLADVLSEYEFDIDYTKGVSTHTGEPLPSITFVEKETGNPMITFRLKREDIGAGYYRNYVEKQAFMGTLIAKAAE